MATTTPNFGWPVPTSTDLVKDGATAIEALGDGIDTSLVDLKGGTTGQVLAKTTGADMDFTWVTTDDANAIQNAIVDAKGDIVAASANDTPARLAVGANGEQLVADSSATTGLRYVATPSASNPVINSGFNVWQRGTTISLGASTSAANGFLADRWQTTTSAAQASTITRQATGDTTNLPFIQYALRYQRNSGQTGTALSGFYQSFETVNSIPFVGKTITLSFYARSGADFSPTSDAIAARVYSGTGTDQSIFSYTGSASVINETKNLTATWQRFTVTSAAPVATTATELAIGFEWTPTGTAGAADYFEVTGVQLDIGNVALPYRAYAATFQGELAAAQRYFQRLDSSNDASLDFGNGAFLSTTLFRSVIPLKVTMRSAPTHDFGTAANFQITSSANFTPASTTLSTSSPNQFCIGVAVTGATAGYGGLLRANSTTSAFMNLSAEL